MAGFWNGRRVGTALSVVLLAAFAAGVVWWRRSADTVRASCPPESRRQLAELQRTLSGALVFQRESDTLPESIWVVEAGETSARCLAAHGRFPRWSPDGRLIAYLDKRNVMIMTAKGRARRCLAVTEDREPRALAFHPSGKEIWYTDGETIRAVPVEGGPARIVRSGLPVRNLDVASGGRRMAIAIRGHQRILFDLDTGRRRDLGRGCSAGLDPSGERFFNLAGSHRRIWICRWEDLSREMEIPAPAGFTVDNETWSNDSRWIAFLRTAQNNRDAVICNLETRQSVRVTFVGDANRPDLFVRAAPRFSARTRGDAPDATPMREQ